jgi:uncharacterized protein (TIGR02145 family)
MKKSFLLFVLACFAFAGVLAQTGDIANLQVSMRTDGSGMVDIHFDLNGTGASYNLQFEASFDDGASYEPLSIDVLTGELINVLPGTSKHIIWDGKASHPVTFSTQARVRVIAMWITPFECGNPLFDYRDNRTYTTIQIGNQCWMAENLKHLPNVSPTSIEDNSEPYNYVYGYEGTNVAEAKATENYQNYGALYNWTSAIAICPDGWHLPTDGEWAFLIDNFGGLNSAGGKMKSTRTAPDIHPRWDSPNTGASNASGFNGLPGGYKTNGGGTSGRGMYGNWWSSSQNGAPYAWQRNLFSFESAAHREYEYKSLGLSVRCVWDEEVTPNQPPVTPSNPSPETGSINQTITPTLSWDCSDPEGDPLTYDVYFGTDENPPLAVSAISEQTYTPAMLEYSKTYYWKIIANDDHGNSTEGEVWSFATEDEWECGDDFIDSRDGNIYSTVQIGDQCWMAENLAYLPEVFPSTQGSETDPYYYVYDYQGTDVNAAKATDNYLNYGVLCNWPAALIACPTGWHLPTDNEWKILEGNSDSQYPVGDPIWDHTGYRGFNAGYNIKSTTGWVANGNGVDLFDFNGLPAGNRFSSEGGKFHGIGDSNKWWSSTAFNTNTSWLRRLDQNELRTGREYYLKSDGFAVRCVKD